ncbi:hypothetical protein BDP27DRAFT_1370168 [Rhodocollybia butyracea]|uniref:DUF6536 domain-containing protein n=1 Tax=Rhodocollybia butyracea TaxID=206335 RepID=A0A9P5PEW7_9AGAR|nr:hypothetical protein BDP27DRAFT_1370168 [Rhodocollybia butyracea]
MHNLEHTSSWKRLLWTLLPVSSIPLHLFYNSSFFSTTSVDDYSYYLAQGPEMQDLPQNIGAFNWECANETLSSACSSVDASELSNWNNLTSSICVKTYACSDPDIDSSNWEFLNPSDCLQAYAVDFLSDRRDIVVVIGDYVANNTFLNLANSSSGQISSEESPGATPFGWICGDTLPNPGVLPTTGSAGYSINWREINPAYWKMPVKFFPAAEESDQFPRPIFESLKVSAAIQPPLLAIVIAFNIVKVTCMAMYIRPTSKARMHDNPLVTLARRLGPGSKAPATARLMRARAHQNPEPGPT